MTQLILKTDLDEDRLNALLHFLKSWGVEAEVKSSALSQNEEDKEFPLTVGLWADRDIDARQLRREACGLSKRRTYSHGSARFSFGMWEDYDIDDKTLREKAWGTYKHSGK
ncbi:MAG: hypothetical protein LBP98_03230 [Tannerella sp.]|nr:hypothetical protein [Tannerella sp.]